MLSLSTATPGARLPRAHGRLRLDALAHPLPLLSAAGPHLRRRVPDRRCGSGSLSSARTACCPRTTCSRECASRSGAGRSPSCGCRRSSGCRTRDAAFRLFGWVGLAGSLVLLAGFANVPLLVALWFLYLSYVHVGGTLLRLRLGDPAARDGLPRDLPRAARAPRPFARGSDPPSPLVISLLRWLIVPPDARRRAHQAARRSVLARPHLPRLPLRDAARTRTRSPGTCTSCRAGSTGSRSSSTTSSSSSRPCFVFGPRRARHVAGRAHRRSSRCC